MTISRRQERLEKLRGLYAIADDGFAETPEALLKLIDAFLRGGADVVQLRCKKLGSGALLSLAREAVSRCRSHGALFILNDRADLAALADADGVHLGQEDLPLAEARKILGPDRLLGLSTHSDEEIDRALAQGADCLGFGPAFATATKRATTPDSVPLPAPHGIAGVRKAVLRAGETPLIAIGGVDEKEIEPLAKTGAACVAVISALCKSSDPESKTRALIAAFQRGAASLQRSQ